jgi:hypothetical protein
MRSFVLLQAVLLALAGQLGAQESPRAVVERALQAHGGYDRLARVKADRVRLRGEVFSGSHAVAFVNEVLVQLPTRFKSTMLLSLPNGKTQTVIHLLDGDTASVTLDGQPLPLPSSQLAQLRQTLLTDPSFSLSPLPELLVNGRPALGVSALGKGQREVRLYFDRPSGLLVKTEHQVDGAGKDVKQEIYYSAFRDLGGYLRPGKVTAYRDGRKILEADLVEATPLDHFEPGEFGPR